MGDEKFDGARIGRWTADAFLFHHLDDTGFGVSGRSLSELLLILGFDAVIDLIVFNQRKKFGVIVFEFTIDSFITLKKGSGSDRLEGKAILFEDNGRDFLDFVGHDGS